MSKRESKLSERRGRGKSIRPSSRERVLEKASVFERVRVFETL